jgi:hypothetical protein
MSSTLCRLKVVAFIAVPLLQMFFTSWPNIDPVNRTIDPEYVSDMERHEPRFIIKPINCFT